MAGSELKQPAAILVGENRIRMYFSRDFRLICGIYWPRVYMIWMIAWCEWLVTADDINQYRKPASGRHQESQTSLLNFWNSILNSWKARCHGQRGKARLLPAGVLLLERVNFPLFLLVNLDLFVPYHAKYIFYRYVCDIILALMRLTNTVSKFSDAQKSSC